LRLAPVESVGQDPCSSYDAWEFSTLPVVAQLRTPRFLLALAGGSVLAALAVGIPTDVIPNPWFQRMTPVRTLDVVLLPPLSLVLGAWLATYALPGGRSSSSLSSGTGSGLLGAFAIGCPVCNKLVILALGFSGALTYFAPIQPVLGAAGLLLAAFALRARLRTLARGCPLNVPAMAGAAGEGALPSQPPPRR